MNFAILATGGIANTMANTVTKMEGVICYAVASRNFEKAQSFADKWGFEKAYGSYEEMLSDPDVELVYVCTPHSHHYQYAKMCLEYGKHVLVEKAFTVSAKQAAELIRISKEKNLLIAEAMWTRYMPSRKMLDEVLERGVIGEVNSLTANLGYPISHVERLMNPALAGGALLDLGVYTINFAVMIFKDNIIKISSDAVMSDTGVDISNSITLTFEGGKMAVLHSTMMSQPNRMGVICGSKGYVEVQNINNCEEIRVYDNNNRLISRLTPPAQITGFEYEVEACVRAIKEGKCECEDMPHSEIIKVMEIMDKLREQWGMKLPCEEC